MNRFSTWAGLFLVLFLTVAVRCWTWGGVFAANGAVLFADPDCYSRMTRVEKVLEGGGVIRAHEFENWPDGVIPHTTWPMDAATALLARGLGPFSEGPRDLAGAWISVLLGAATAFFLWFWWGNRPFRLAGGVLFAVSPLLVHGTVLGRPDHQSLLLAVLAAVLGAEARLLRQGEGTLSKRQWLLVGGLSATLALWTSFYEPLVLFVATLLFSAALAPRRFFCKERGMTLAGVGVAVCGLYLLEGRAPLPVGHLDPEVIRYFPAWSRTVGELAHVPPLSSVWLGWTLAWLPLTVGLLFAVGRRDREGWYWLGLLLPLFGLTCWQARWGYFFSLAFVMSLPMQMGELARWLPKWKTAVPWTLFFLALWPVAREWDRRFTPQEVARRREQRDDLLALREVALQLKGERRLPVLAPWWFCPALAYWSGQPCVAGSSHQSLPGIADTARFWLASDFSSEGVPLLEKRKVACIVAYEPQRVVPQAIALLGPDEASGKAPGIVLGTTLFTRPSSPPEGLEWVYSNRAFRVYLYPPGIQ